MSRRRDRVLMADGVASKHHGGDDGELRASRAAAAMRAASDAGLPVPPIVGHVGAMLRTRLVEDATPGHELLHTDPDAVLRAIGGFAASLHTLVPPAPIGGRGVDTAWVHGDLCPLNLLLRDGALVAVLDWEDTRVDDPLVDVVWTEWLVRTHHVGVVGSLPALWAGYGTPPPPPERRREAMRRVLEHRREREGRQREEVWQRHLTALPDLELAIGPDGGGAASPPADTQLQRTAVGPDPAPRRGRLRRTRTRR